MALFPYDVASLLGSLGVAGTSLFVGTKASIPDVDTAVISIVGTGGSGPQYVQNSASPAYRLPTAQVTVRAKKMTDAETKAVQVFNILAAVRNQTVNGTWYRRMRPLQSEPFDGGVDERGRATMKFNVLGDNGA